jgi:hypothetical protein
VFSQLEGGTMKFSVTGILCTLGLAAMFWGSGTVRSTNTPPATLGVVRAPSGPGQGSVTGFDVAAHLTNQDLTIQSDLIVIGKAVESRLEWVNDGRNLYTLVTVSVEETLKGAPGATATVAIPGGVDANRRIPIAMTFPGAPRIAPDEEVFLFLTHADDEVAGSYGITGFAQGKFSIVPGDQGMPAVSRNLSGLRTVSSDRAVRGGDTLVPLAAFKQEISGYLQQ